jgi:predicted MFS family arabinose efflux permease
MEQTTMSASETSPNITEQSEFRWTRMAATILFFINGIIIGSWAPQIPGFVSRLGISEFTLGLLMLGYGLGALAAMTMAGQLIARVGARKTFRMFFLPILVLMPLAVQTSNLWMGVAILTLFGGAIGGIDVAMNANVVAVEKQLGRATMSTAHGCWSLGAFIGGGLGGIGIEMFGALQQSVTVLIAAAAIFLFFDAHITETTDQPQNTSKKRFIWPTQPAIYIVGIMALLCMSAEGAVLNWSTLFLQKELLANTAIVGFAFAGFSGAMSLTRFFGDSIRNRFGAVALFQLSSSVAAVGMLSAGLSPWPWLSIVSFALSGIGMANLVPILLSAAGKQPGLNAGVSVSFVTTISHMGLLLVPSIIGFVAGQSGLAVVYVAFAVMLGATCFLSGQVAPADVKSGHV